LSDDGKVGWRHRNDALGTERSEHLREAAVSDHRAKVGEPASHPRRHLVVDGREHLRTVDLPGNRRKWSLHQGTTDEPSDKQDGEARHDRPTDRVDGPGGLPPQPSAHDATEGARPDAPERGNREDDGDTSEGRHRAGEVFRDQRRELRSDDRATEQPDERQNPDDEALPVARERRENDQHDQNQVEGVGVHTVKPNWAQLTIS